MPRPTNHITPLDLKKIGDATNLELEVDKYVIWRACNMKGIPREIKVAKKIKYAHVRDPCTQKIELIPADKLRHFFDKSYVKEVPSELNDGNCCEIGLDPRVYFIDKLGAKQDEVYKIKVDAVVTHQELPYSPIQGLLKSFGKMKTIAGLDPPVIAKRKVKKVVANQTKRKVQESSAEKKTKKVEIPGVYLSIFDDAVKSLESIGTVTCKDAKGHQKVINFKFNLQ